MPAKRRAASNRMLFFISYWFVLFDLRLVFPVNHKDKNRQNNCVDNLEWCTTQYNVEYSRAKQVAQYDLNGNLIATWKSVREIERQTGFLQGSISDCCRGHRNCKTMYGYIWRYI